MNPLGDARSKFSIQFFLVGILFLIFDLEVIFLFPFAVSLYHVSFYGFWIAIVFLIVLTVGFIYEFSIGALKFHKPTTSSSTSHINSPPSSSISASSPINSASSLKNSFSHQLIRLFSTDTTANGRRKRIKGDPRYTRVYKLSMTVPSDLQEILIGLILGDVSVSKKASVIGGHHLYFRHSMDQHPYMLHLFSLFSDFVVLPGPSLGSSYDKRTDKIYYFCAFATLSCPCFAYYRNLFYNSEGVKTIPHNISELLTPRSLAYWFQDDGSKHGDGGYYLSTDAFSLEQVNLLINALFYNFGLKTTVHKTGSNGQFAIYISATSANLFKSIISEFIHPSLRYKLHGE